MKRLARSVVLPELDDELVNKTKTIIGLPARPNS
jgi:hypothetical protein